MRPRFTGAEQHDIDGDLAVVEASIVDHSARSARLQPLGRWRQRGQRDGVENEELELVQKSALTRCEASRGSWSKIALLSIPLFINKAAKTRQASLVLPSINKDDNLTKVVFARRGELSSDFLDIGRKSRERTSGLTVRLRFQEMTGDNERGQCQNVLRFHLS